MPQLTALEIDPELADSLSSRLAESNVRVVEGDATDMPFRDSEFSGSVSFTMLHHVPSRELQDKVLRETYRVLRPGSFLWEATLSRTGGRGSFISATHGFR